MYSLLVVLTVLVLGTDGMRSPANRDWSNYLPDDVQRGLQASNLDTSGVVQEAFDSEGDSLGIRDDADDSDWTVSDVDFGNLTTATAFMYHQNASHYIVGNGSGILVEFWHPHGADCGGGDMAAVHLSIASAFVLSSREDSDGEDSVRVKVVNAGWERVREAEMNCENPSGDDCPTLVLAETMNMVYRFANQDSAILDAFVTDWALEEGWMITDDFIKYYAYDFSIDGKWIGVPLVSDIRVLAYNKTTFETFDISAPPGTDSSESWGWEDFLEAARQLTLATGEPGWYFGGGFAEEMKLSLMIARNWGATLYREEEDDGQLMCALDENFAKAMNSTIEIMLKEGLMSANLAPPMDVDMNLDNETFNPIEEFQRWKKRYDHPGKNNLTAGGPEPSRPRGCLEVVLPTNSSEMLGMAIVSPQALLQCTGNDIGIAYVPGRYGYLGGTGLFVGNNLTQELKEHAWGLAQSMMENASLYAVLHGSPPPFEKLLENEKWSTGDWPLKVAQMHKSVPTQYPQHGAYNFLNLQEANPFRKMWTEMAFEGVSASEATKSLAEFVDEILYVHCTEDNFEFANCRKCETDDYDYNISSCDPATQSHSVVFFPSPSEEDGDCFITEDDALQEDSVKCDHVEYKSGFGVAIIIVSCLGGLLALASAALVFRYRRRPFIKFSQPTFCVLFSLGLAGLCLSNVALVGPNTPSSCVSRFALPGMAFDLAFGALFSKVYRVRWVVASVTRGRGRHKQKSFLPVVAVVSLALVVDLVVLAAWGVWDEYGPVEVDQQVTKYTVKMSECASDVSSFAIIFFALKIALIAWGVYLAWVTRNINYTLVEGREMTWGIYLFAALIAILVLVGYADLKVEYWALARAFVFCLSSCTVLVMVLVPKLWAAHLGKDVDMSMLTSSATSARATRGTVEPWGHSVSVSDLDPWAMICTQCNKITTPVLVADACDSKHARGTTKRTVGPKFNPPIPSMGVKRGDSALAAGASLPLRPPNWRTAAMLHGVYGPSSGFPSADELRRFYTGPVGTASGVVSQENLSGGGSSSPWSPAESLSDWRRKNGRHVATSVESSGNRRLAVKDGPDELCMPKPRSASCGIIDDAVARFPATSRGIGLVRSKGSATIPEELRQGGNIAGETSCGSSMKESTWGSWRRSLPSNFSSASGYSELNAASFRRSVQAQTAALRAALWGSSRSSVQTSQAGVGWSSAGSSSWRGSRDSRGSRGSAYAASDVEAAPPSRHRHRVLPDGESVVCSSGGGKPSATSGTSGPSSASSFGVVQGGKSLHPQGLSLAPLALESFVEECSPSGKIEEMGKEPLSGGDRECDSGKQTSRGFCLPLVLRSNNTPSRRTWGNVFSGSGLATSSSISSSRSDGVSSRPESPRNKSLTASMTSIGMSSAAFEASAGSAEDDPTILLSDVISLKAHRSGAERAMSLPTLSVYSSGRTPSETLGETVGLPVSSENRRQDTPTVPLRHDLHKTVSAESRRRTGSNDEAHRKFTSPNPSRSRREDLSESNGSTRAPKLVSDGESFTSAMSLPPIPVSSVACATGDELERTARSGEASPRDDGQRQEDHPGATAAPRALGRGKLGSRLDLVAYSISTDCNSQALGDVSAAMVTPTPTTRWRPDYPGEWTPPKASRRRRSSSGGFCGGGYTGSRSGLDQVPHDFSFSVSEIASETLDVEWASARSRRFQSCNDGDTAIPAAPVPRVRHGEGIVPLLRNGQQRSGRTESPKASEVGVWLNGTPGTTRNRTACSATPARRWSGSVGCEDETTHGLRPHAAAPRVSPGVWCTAEDQAAVL